MYISMNQHSIGNFGRYIQPILKAQLSYINLLTSNMQKYNICIFQVNYNHYTSTMASDANKWIHDTVSHCTTGFWGWEIYTVVCVFDAILCLHTLFFFTLSPQKQPSFHFEHSYQFCVPSENIRYHKFW